MRVEDNLWGREESFHSEEELARLQQGSVILQVVAHHLGEKNQYKVNSAHDYHCKELMHNMKYLNQGIEDPHLPVGIIALEADGLACVGVHHQAFYLDEEWPYAVILTTQGAKHIGTKPLLKLKIRLYNY